MNTNKTVMNTNKTIKATERTNVMSEQFQRVPQVHMISSSSYRNVLLGYVNNVWGSSMNGRNETSYNKVNVGDYIVVYVSDKETDEQASKKFHLVGRVKSKSDKTTYNDNIWGERYNCITEMEWMNTPALGNAVPLSNIQEISGNYNKTEEFMSWRGGLFGQWFPVSDKNIGINSETFLYLLSRLKYGFQK